MEIVIFDEHFLRNYFQIYRHRNFLFKPLFFDKFENSKAGFEIVIFKFELFLENYILGKMKYLFKTILTYRKILFEFFYLRINIIEILR